MKLKYKHQDFQDDATRAVTDCFLGQPHYGGASNFLVDQGSIRNAKDGNAQDGKGQSLIKDQSFYHVEGFANAQLQEDLPLRDNIRRIQTEFGIKPIEAVEHLDKDKGLTLTIEMETGTGKTFTYIKTMYELNRLYGWTKFIVVVPSIAIREGVLSSFESMSEYFAQQYNGKRIQYFVYNSKQLSKIDTFAQDPGMHVMIINTQAFNSSFDDAKNKEGRGGDAAARIIFTRRDEFSSRRPIDIIAATRPIMIIDEPQSVLGANKNNHTREGIKLFNPLFKLLYSATHRKDDIANMVYRLDAMDAYNKHLVKKIEVVGVEQVGTTATNGYVYFEQLIISKGDPQARINFDYRIKNGTSQKSIIVKAGDDLYPLSEELPEYQGGFVVDDINGIEKTIKFQNGIVLQEGQMRGTTNIDIIRRNQIRETIRKHIERESELYLKRIKVLSLFFIDHVSNYRVYDQEDTKGKYAKMFEEEYPRVLQEYYTKFGDTPYMNYLRKTLNDVSSVHQGYFSMDKKGHMVDPSKSELKNDNSNDESAYDLIMKDKERLLSFKEPVRFIFSHSALKEGWDNPNVFQICTLKDGANENKKRQEVGRGMRLCVNERGERQDAEVLGNEGVFDVNILTVIASESYSKFAKGLQTEIADACADRPDKVNENLFAGLKYTTSDNIEHTISEDKADEIQYALIMGGYIDNHGKLTAKYFADKEEGKLNFGNVEDLHDVIVKQLDNVFNPDSIKPRNGRDNETAKFEEDKFKDEFLQLWNKINVRSFYTVHFDSEKLKQNAINELNKKLNVTEIRIVVSHGSLEKIENKQDLENGTAMTAGKNKTVFVNEAVGSGVKYDLIGQLVSKTGLTRKTIVDILQGMSDEKFSMFKMNPEEFIMRTANIINSQKAISVVEHIKYNKLDKTFEEDVFTQTTLRGKIGENAMRSKKSLYDLVVVDSKGEMNFAQALENEDVVEVYTKLPRKFYINTPMGEYNPDWAVVFKEGTVKHIYFIAETKGNTLDADLRPVESAKIECAKKHFLSIGASDVTYEPVSSWQELWNKARQ